ncbi:ATP synthase complex subunit H-domain-containing protein [Dipodascopsis uninucleata]
MFAQSVRVVARASTPFLRRGFATSVARRDLVQDMYLKELKSYKAPTITASDAVGQVKPWVPPTAPAVPTVEASSDADISEYATQTVEVEGIAEVAEESTSDIDDWFVVEPLEDHH